MRQKSVNFITYAESKKHRKRDKVIKRVKSNNKKELYKKKVNIYIIYYIRFGPQQFVKKNCHGDCRHVVNVDRAYDLVYSDFSSSIEH